MVAIIGLLIGLLLPSIQSARESARRVQCSNNLRQLAVATQNHLSSSGGEFPPGLACNSTASVALFAYLLPYIEEAGLAKRFNMVRRARTPSAGRQPSPRPSCRALYVLPIRCRRTRWRYVRQSLVRNDELRGQRRDQIVPAWIV